ncbi:hypothetical protein ColLi_13427 [Colletotrichum liriopes]|uniref:Uncharacterized protein n=1 Tax=Colletotrichum liriopes TaxID=708192 RepID=A0AA37H130_9PEZI|nr:hypothetical protein ColLi_13427 [Colletotrichum liriopes]
MVRLAFEILTRLTRASSEPGGTHSPSSSSSSTTAQLQPFELCFHDDFLADDTRPISLHFHTSSTGHPLVTFFPPLLTYSTPSPPHYVHELPSIIDLTTSMTLESSRSPRSSSPAFDYYLAPVLHHSESPPSEDHSDPRSRPLTGRRPSSPTTYNNTPPWLLLLGIVIVALATAFCLAFTKTSCAHGPHPLNDETHCYQAHNDTPYQINTRHITAPLAIHVDAMRFFESQASLLQSLSSFMIQSNDTGMELVMGDNVLSSLSTLLINSEAVCRDAAVLVTLRSRADTADAIKTLCHGLFTHIHHTSDIWHQLQSELSNSWSNKALINLQYTVMLLRDVDAQNETDLAQTYRQALFGLEAASRVASCGLCQELSPWPLPFPPEDDPFVVPLTKWHFACSPNFTQKVPPPDAGHGSPSSVDIAAHLQWWADSQSERRHETLQNPALDVDGEPRYPNDRHPILESDDVNDLNLPGEDDIFALTRHAFELRATAQHLLVILAGLGLGVGSDPLVDEQGTFAGGSAVGPGGGGGGGAWRQSWFGGGGGGGGSTNRPNPSRGDLVRNGAGRMTELLTVLDASFSELGKASAGLTASCKMARTLWNRLDEIEMGRGLVQWTASVKEDEGVVVAGSSANRNSTSLDSHSHSPRLMMDVVQTRYTAQPLLEAEALAEGANKIASLFPRPPPRVHHPNLPVSETPPFGEYEASDDEDNAVREFNENLKGGILYVTLLDEFMSMLRPASPTTTTTTTTTTTRSGSRRLTV